MSEVKESSTLHELLFSGADGKPSGTKFWRNVASFVITAVYLWYVWIDRVDPLAGMMTYFGLLGGQFLLGRGLSVMDGKRNVQVGTK